MRILSIALVFFSIIGITCFTLRPVGADASAPNISVGDYWNYNYWILSGPFNLTGTLKQTVTAAVTVSSGGSSYDAFNVSQSGSGYAAGGPYTGSWTLTGSTLYQRSNLASIRGSGVVSLTVNQISATVKISSASTPAEGGLNFPLSVAESWTQTVTTKTNTTTMLTIFPNPPTTTAVSTTNTTTTTYAVIDNPILKVPAGTFDTYEVRSSDQRTTHLIYYSPQTNQAVKEVDSNSTTGQVTGSFSLKDYSSWPYAASYDLRSGQHALVRTDVPLSSFNHNLTVLSFQVTGREGTSGRASITLPRQFNETHLTLYVDGQAKAGTITATADNFTMSIQLTYSTHTLMIRYGAEPQAKVISVPSTPFNLILIGGIVAVVVLIIVASIVALRRRGGRKPQSTAWTPAEAPPPPSVPGPAPSTP